MSKIFVHFRKRVVKVDVRYSEMGGVKVADFIAVGLLEVCQRFLLIVGGTSSRTVEETIAITQKNRRTGIEAT